MMAVIKGIGPSNQLQAMLAVHMAVIHLQVVRVINRHDQVDVLGQDIGLNTLCKLNRTFAMLVDTLHHMRSGGEQRVTVRHVSVNDGGRAVVGNVTQASPATAVEKPEIATPALTDELSATERAEVEWAKWEKEHGLA